MTLSDRERQALAEIEARLRLHRPSRIWRLLGWLRYGLFGRRYRRPPRSAPARRRRRGWSLRLARRRSARGAVLLALLALAVGVLIGLALAH
jgi:hypothetical protein